MDVFYSAHLIFSVLELKIHSVASILNAYLLILIVIVIQIYIYISPHEWPSEGEMMV